MRHMIVLLRGVIPPLTCLSLKDRDVGAQGARSTVGGLPQGPQLHLRRFPSPWTSTTRNSSERFKKRLLKVYTSQISISNRNIDLPRPQSGKNTLRRKSIAQIPQSTPPRFELWTFENPKKKDIGALLRELALGSTLCEVC